MANKLIKPKTPFKRLIDAALSALKKYGTSDERSLNQKKLDLWFTNINYYCTSYRGELMECLSGDAPEDAGSACPEALRIVAQNATMRIGNGECAALRETFANSWAIPRSFEANSKRHEKDHPTLLGEARDVETSLGMYYDAFRQFVKTDRFEKLKASIHEEIAFYDALRNDERISPTIAYRMMLPIWIVRDASPLYRLSFWDDEQALNEICGAVCEGFMDHKEEFQAFGTIGMTECQNYTTEARQLARKLADCDESGYEVYSGMSVAQMYAALYRGQIDVDYESFPKDFPEAAKLRAQLIWNLIGGALYGPMQATSWMKVITEESDNDAKTVAYLDTALEAGCGKAIFRQLQSWDEESLASARTAFDVELGSDDFETETPDEGLVAVIGRAYSPGYTPILQFSEKDNPGLYQLCASVGVVDPPVYFSTDMVKDSGWHLGVFLQGEPRMLYLVDLGSLNGTYVIRESGDGGKRAYAFSGRDEAKTREELVKPMLKLGISCGNVEVVGYLAARRHDIIILGDSQFEIL